MSGRCIGRLLTWTASLAIAACADGREATEIMLTVDTDLDAAEIDHAVVRVFYLPEDAPTGAPVDLPTMPRLDLGSGDRVTIGGTEYLHRWTMPFRVSAGETFPIEVGVVPEDGDHARIAYFEAYALRCTVPDDLATCTVITATAARTAFVPRRRVRLVLWLTAACEGMACPTGEVCRYDTCVPVDYPPECLTSDEVLGTDRPLCAADIGPCAEPLPFEYSNTPEPFMVPNRVRFMYVKAWGAGGNDASNACPPEMGLDGGVGGFTEAVFAVEPGMVFTAIVGEGGRAGLSGSDAWRFGFGAWGGGGLSGVFRGDTPPSDTDTARALVIAGGGGSGAGPSCQYGQAGNDPAAGGQPTMMGEFEPGGGELGGGGGYSGGHAGARDVAAGGGSGYVDPAATGFHIETGDSTRNLPPRTDDPDYGTYPAGSTESNGRLVVKFLCEDPLI